MDARLVPVPVAADVRLAGQATVHHVAASFDDVPTGGPRKLRGILLQDGVIWLPTDGTQPYISSGH
jgi:hypothetical protein